MKNALIIFVKNPEAGKVKTRLASTLGAKKALEIYLLLLDHTRSVSTALVMDKFIFYADKVDYSDLWPNASFYKRQQQGNHLGERMLNAFRETFEAGYNKVSIIGSDCVELTAAIIEKGFDELDSSDAVIGPATDGGYYLIGLNKLHTALFCNIEWSTPNVLRQTVEACNNNQLAFKFLPVLSDIDKEEDWVKASQHIVL